MTTKGIPTRTLGRTGLDVTVLGFGAMELRGANAWKAPRPLDPDDVRDLLNLVLDAGINFVDTSIEYGDSETSIGNYISQRRDEFFLATKCGCPLDPAHASVGGRVAPHVYTREHITTGLEQSLRKLRTDHVDLLQLHMSPSLERVRADDVVATMQDLQATGKVRFIGSSSTLPDAEDLVALGVFDVFQIPYSALERAHEKVIRAAAATGAGVIIRGGVAKGSPNAGGDKWAAFDRAGLHDLLDGAAPAEFLLRYTISHPDVSTVIVGTADPEHVAANVRAVAKGSLPEDRYAEATRRLDAI